MAKPTRLGAPRVGIVGTGFIARGVAFEVSRAQDLTLGPVLTRRPPREVEGLGGAKLVRSSADLVDGSDIVLECSGDIVHATPILEHVLDTGMPVVTMDSELHVTTGTWLARRGFLTEAEGDQPGCLVRLHHEALERGFEPLVYINLKGFLDTNPERATMEYWAERQSFRLEQAVSFTDGSKVEIEKALVANALEASVPPPELAGRRIDSIADSDYLVELARERGGPVTDFVLAENAPPGVVVLAEHPQARTIPHYRPLSRLLTTGESAYQLLRPHHLCHLEVLHTIREVLAGAPPLLNNTQSPVYGAYAIAKRDLAPGELVAGLGGFEVRAETVPLFEADAKDLAPICLTAGGRVTGHVAKGEFLRCKELELEPSRALEVWRELRLERERAVARARPDARRKSSS